jgi:hypothetical protein
MTDRVPNSIRELREAAEQGDYFLNAETMLALLDIAEAAQTLDIQELRAGLNWMESETNSVGDHEALDRLVGALARFDFGNTP